MLPTDAAGKPRSRNRRTLSFHSRGPSSTHLLSSSSPGSDGAGGAAAAAAVAAGIGSQAHVKAIRCACVASCVAIWCKQPTHPRKALQSC